MDDNGYLLVSLLCSYLHTARRFSSFLVFLLHGTGVLHSLSFASIFSSIREGGEQGAKVVFRALCFSSLLYLLLFPCTDEGSFTE